MEVLIFIVISIGAYFYFKKKEEETPLEKYQANEERYSIYARIQEDKDNFEGWFYDSVHDYISYKKRLRIVYIDGNGKKTERNIWVYNFSQNPYRGFFLARCELRDANRTFRADRIQSCIDLDTGEYVANVTKHLLDCYHKSDEYKKILEKEEKQEQQSKENEYFLYLTNKYDTLMKVIMYIVRCDGTFNQKEKAIVKEILQDLEDNNEILSNKFLDKFYNSYPLPTLQTFKVNVAKIIKEKEFKIDLLELAENIVSTQKTVHESEKELLEYLREKTKNLSIKDKIAIPKNNYEVQNKSMHDKICPYCQSINIFKKGLRSASNHINQRYQCNNCGKIFSEKIEESSN